MKKLVLIVGLGRFGRSLAMTLSELGHDVLAIDSSEKRVQGIAQKITHAVQADATDEDVLRELGVQNFDVGVVAIGTNVQNNVLSTILLREMNVPFVVARAQNDLHGKILARIGANKVIYPEQDMGIRLAHVLTLADVSDYMSVSGKYGVARILAPPYLIGRKLSELGFGPEGRYDVAVLLVQHENEAVIVPGKREVIMQGDILILAGDDDKLDQILKDARKLEEEQEREKQDGKEDKKGKKA
ncbi:potassium channel family protein [Chloroflexota bacterium]